VANATLMEAAGRGRGGGKPYGKACYAGYHGNRASKLSREPCTVVVLFRLFEGRVHLVNSPGYDSKLSLNF